MNDNPTMLRARGRGGNPPRSGAFDLAADSAAAQCFYFEQPLSYPHSVVQLPQRLIIYLRWLRCNDLEQLPVLVSGPGPCDPAHFVFAQGEMGRGDG